MTREKAIKILRETYCGNRAFCELFRVDRCRTTDCEIYHAIKALENEPNSCEYWDSESCFCALRRPQAEVESDIDENWYSDEYRRIGEDERDEVE